MTTRAQLINAAIEQAAAKGRATNGPHLWEIVMRALGHTGRLAYSETIPVHTTFASVEDAIAARDAVPGAILGSDTRRRFVQFGLSVAAQTVLWPDSEVRLLSGAVDLANGDETDHFG